MKKYKFGNPLISKDELDSLPEIMSHKEVEYCLRLEPEELEAWFEAKRVIEFAYRMTKDEAYVTYLRAIKVKNILDRK